MRTSIQEIRTRGSKRKCGLIALPFGILLLVFAVRVFHGIITTPGSHTGCIEVIFTFAATAFLTAIVGGIGGLILFGLASQSSALAWLALLAFSALCIFMHDYNKKKKARQIKERRAAHESWLARHKDDLCNYCDAWRDGDGNVHHAPSCRNR
ncbi:MAG: hypothetical protein FJW40_21140 [Acidobacteria bacterium]|nr:hypothetical protein [Acidobacteriota bacterium]